MMTFIEDLKKELKKMNIDDNQINEIISDHEEMIEVAKADGLDDQQISDKLGNPKKIAAELAEFEKKQEQKEETDQEYIFTPTSEPIRIDTKLLSEDTAYRITSGDKIRVLVTGKKQSDDYEVTFENNQLSVHTVSKKIVMGIIRFNRKFEFLIEIPEHVQIEQLIHTAVSADLTINGLSPKTTKINTTDGDIQINQLKSVDVSIRTVNGDLSLSDVQCDTLGISTISGDAEMHHVDVVSDLSINTVSGDLEFKDGHAEAVYLQTISGDINGHEFYMKKVSINTISGDVNLANSRHEEVEVIKRKSLSGDIHLHL